MLLPNGKLFHIHCIENLKYFFMKPGCTKPFSKCLTNDNQHCVKVEFDQNCHIMKIAYVIWSNEYFFEERRFATRIQISI